MHVPKNSYADPSVIPRGLKWARDSRGKKEGGKDLMTYRLFLDQLTEEQVNWNVWAGVDPIAHADLLRSRQATGRRILLEGPFCRQWYLGERVVRQSLGYDAFKVPKPIPSSMLNTRSLTVKDVAQWTEGEDATACLEESGDYEEYMVQMLMPALGKSTIGRGPPSRPLAGSVPAAAAAGGGRGGGRGGLAEVPAGAVLPELPQLPWRVDYYNSTGQRQFVDIPIPEDIDFTLPPSVQQVPREYVEACFRNLSGLRVLVRQLAMAGQKVRPPTRGPLQTQGRRVASAECGASAPHGKRVSSAGRGAPAGRSSASRATPPLPLPPGNGNDEEELEEEEEDTESASIEVSPSSKKPRR